MDLERRLLRDMGRAIGNHQLIEAGDRIMVAMSGGKDSYAHVRAAATRSRRRAPVAFELIAVHLDQGHPGYDGAPLERWLAAEGFRTQVLHEDTYSIVTDKIPEGKTYCSLCARACGAGSSTARPASSAATRSRSATTATTRSRRCC